MSKLERVIRQVSDLREFYRRLKSNQETKSSPLLRGRAKRERNASLQRGGKGG
jgi:hypothetical protein